MNCEIWQDKIDAFVDSELTPGQTQGFEEHLRSCPACSAETLSRQRLKAETRLAGLRFTPSPEFTERIRNQVGARSLKRSPRWYWFPALASATAVLVLTIVASVIWRNNLLQRELVTQLVDQHVTALASSNPVDILSTDSHTVKPWFSGKVPFSVDIPPLQGTQFTLIGGRLAYFQQAPIAQLIFGVRKHRISVFMFPDHGETAALGNETLPVRRMGFATETWVEDGVRYFAISDVNSEDIRQLCDLLKQSS
jgi:anti-sigma factor RsiW